MNIFYQGAQQLAFMTFADFSLTIFCFSLTTKLIFFYILNSKFANKDEKSIMWHAELDFWNTMI